MASDRIVVGVDASASARSALLWAADECRLRNRSLLVAHAPDRTDAVLALQCGEMALRATDAIGAHLLMELVILASTRQPGVAVSSALAHSPASEALIDLSVLSDLVVVGRRPGGGTTLSLLGSIADRVAAHAACPVAVVPVDHHLRAVPARRRIVVGASADPAGQAAIRFAFEEAAYRGVSVCAVQAIAPEPAATAPTGRAAALDRILIDARDQYPEVSVERRRLVGDPGQVLLRLSREAELVVIGCHHSDDRWSTRLGRVPSTLLNQIQCPLVIVGTTTGLPSAVPAESVRSRIGTNGSGPATSRG